MKSIIAKLGRVPRYGVAVILAAACCFSASADCTVRWDEQAGGWWINCNFGDSTFVPAEDVGGGGGGGSGGGSCTNCTAMSPADCEALKSSIYSQSEEILMTALDSYSELNGVDNAITSFQNGLDTLGTRDNYIDISSFNFDEIIAPTVDWLRGELDNLSSTRDNLRSGIDSVISGADTLMSFSDGMDCSACSASGGGGGTSSGGGSESGTTPSGCPCSEFINAVKDAVNNCKTKLDDIDNKIGSIKSTLESWDQLIKQIKDDVHSICQTTDRMDDFFRDDTEVNFKKLIEHVLVLSNAVFNATVKLPPNLYWTEYTNATQFLNADGSFITWLDKGKTIEAGADGAVIDFGEYSTLNWFQRMEFLLGHIAGIFSPTNSTNADFSSKEKEKVEEAQEVFDGLTFDGEKSVLKQMVQYVENIEDSLNPFHGLFDYSSGSARSITFLPDVSVDNDLLSNTMPMITMDLTETGDGPFSISDLVDLAHNLTTFLWLVSFLIIDVLAIIKFVQCLIAINRWYWKIYNSWVSTMFNGGGR